MKKILSIFIIALSCFSMSGVEAKAIKSFSITKNNMVLANLSINNSLTRAIKSGDLHFEVLGEKKLQVVNLNNKIYLHIAGFNVSEKGLLRIQYKGKQKDIPYKVDYFLNEKNPDIQKDLLLKRIQKRPLSCEASVVSDIVYFLNGKYVDEYEVFDKMDKDLGDTQAYKKYGRYIWGNPDKGFVGYVDYFGQNNQIKPTQRLMTGYGVYEKPLAKLYNDYGLQTKIINNTDYSHTFQENEHLSYILEEFDSGKMVQLWGDRCTYSENDDGTIARGEMNQSLADKGKSGKNTCATLYEDRTLVWYYEEDGILKKHEGWRGEHAFYLLGYTGESSAPMTIKIWDTDTGYHEYDIKEWMRKWSKVDYRSLIIWKK